MLDLGSVPSEGLYGRVFKRTLDVVLSIAGLVVLAPLLALTALLIWWEDGLPVVFRQRRVGRGGASFVMYKFRSMPVNTPEMTASQGRRLAVTAVGRVIRRLSIDELPQLWNVLKGEMSLVGPRPILLSMHHLIGLRRRSGALRVRPGLTGHAQLLATDGMSEEEKAKRDQQYCDDITFFRDCKLLLKSIPYVLKTPPAD